MRVMQRQAAFCCVGVALGRKRAECGFQVTEPRLEMPPLIEARRADRLAHLFRTGGADRPRGQVRREARGLERQPAPFEQPADLGFRIGDQRLVPDPDHPAGKHAVEMVHQRDIVGVVASDLAEIVAPCLAAGEMLLPRRKARGQRMPPRIDDRRVRQDEVDQPGKGEIVRQLVDEARPRRLALRPRAIEIIAPQRRHRRRVERGERFEIARVGIARPGFGERPRQRRQIGQFRGTFDAAVAGEDLLDQRRSRSRQTDDEDRVGGAIAPAAPRGEEVGRQDAGGGGDMIAVAVGIPAHLGAAAGVGAGVMIEGGGMVGRVLQRLAEREMQVEAVVVGQPLPRQRRAHRRDVVGSEAEGLEVGEAPPGLAERRAAHDGGAIGGDALRRPPDGLERMALAHPRLGVFGVAGEQAGIQRDRRVMLALTRQHGGLQVDERRIAGLALQQHREFSERRRALRLAVQHQREVETRGIELRRDRDRPAQQGFRFGKATQPPGDFGHHAQRIGIGGVGAEPRRQRRMRDVEIVARQRGGSVHQARIARRRRHGHRGRQWLWGDSVASPEGCGRCDGDAAPC